VDAFGQVHTVQALVHLLAREQRLDAIVEGQRDQR